MLDKNKPTRLFVALEVPDDLRGEVRNLTEGLSASTRGVKWVAPERLHLTLKFLGYTPDEKIAPIIEELVSIAKRQSPYSMRLGSLGAFPSLSRPLVIWLGLELGEDATKKLQNEVESSMEKLGFMREEREFSAHLTIGRMKMMKGGKNAAPGLSGNSFRSSCAIDVTALRLIESRLTPSRSDLYHRQGSAF